MSIASRFLVGMVLGLVVGRALAAPGAVGAGDDLAAALDGAAPSGIRSATPTTAQTAAPAPPDGQTMPQTRRSSTAGTVVGSRQDAVPSDAVVVAPWGDDEAAGTESAPLRTLTQAVSVAPAGGTVVVRGGTYHESVVVGPATSLTIQSWPGEEVWLDGTIPVRGWVGVGDVWRRAGWDLDLDTSPTYTRGAPDNDEDGWRFLHPDRPLAAHPEQVWIDDVAMRQVGSLAEVAEGTFFQDRQAGHLYLGSDPNSGEVRASVLRRAFRLQGEGSVLRGVGIRRYAPSVPDLGAVVVEARGVVIEDVAILDSSTTGISVVTSDVTLRNLHVARSGMLGIHGNHADNLLIEAVLSEDNNVEGFNTAPVSGGAKITRSREVEVRDSVFRDNHGPGLWLDESVRDMRIVGNDLRDNDRHGASIEISHLAVFADNVVAGNGDAGVKINNTSAVRVWNNTFVDNHRSVLVAQDERRHGPETPGRDPRHRDDPEMTWLVGPVEIRNNVIATSGVSSCLLCVIGHVHADRLGLATGTNLYNRPDRASGTSVVVYSVGRIRDVRYADIDAFTRARGHEVGSSLVVGPTVVSPDGVATTALPDQARARPLPRDLAELVGQPLHSRHLGAWW